MAELTNETSERPSSAALEDVREGEAKPRESPRDEASPLRPSGPTRDAVVCREFPEGMAAEMLVHAQDMTNEVLLHAPRIASDVATHAQGITDEVLHHSQIAAGDVRRETPILMGHLWETLGEMFWPDKADGSDGEASDAK